MSAKKEIEFKATIDGMYCRLTMWWDPTWEAYNIIFCVSKSRRLANDYTRKGVGADITGKGGIRPLQWALKITQEMSEKVPIVVSGSDSRRFKVYKRKLEKIGWGHWKKHPYEVMVCPSLHKEYLSKYS